MTDADVQAMREWMERPEVFVRQVIGVTPDGWQDEVLRAVALYQRIALKSSKGPGKSALLAWIAWWFFATRWHPKIVCTSVSGDNLRDGLWAELSKWQQGSKLLRKTAEWKAERVSSLEHPETWWMSARQWSKSADTNAQSDTLAGIHADHVLFLVDEAGGIPDAVVATAEAGLANADPASGREAKLVIAGNPTETSGPLWRACGRERPLWWVKEISGDPDDPNRAPRVSVQWAREQIEKYGSDNPWVQVNVFGRFPPGQANTLVGVEEAASATRKDYLPAEYLEEARILGVDVARFGDDRTVLFPRQGRVAFRPQVYRNLDTMQVVGEVCRLQDTWKPDITCVDVTGVGAGVVDRLKQLRRNVVPVDFGSKASSGKYVNRRSEMWWEMADWIRQGGALPNLSELISELSTPTYHFDRSGRLGLEPKADIKSRGLPSPDVADALALTFAVRPQVRHPLEGEPRADLDYHPYEEALGA